ncbi:MAG: ABC transporter ATP-binding protein [Gammaproteobacteria bacterium]|nr:MAG: ABC transporter ATP-binding protein [Gammaproteobacteria bacterium]
MAHGAVCQPDDRIDRGGAQYSDSRAMAGLDCLGPGRFDIDAAVCGGPIADPATHPALRQAGELKMSTLVELESIGVAFRTKLHMGSKRFWALENVSMRLNRGDRVGVIGRNGAGKSTLLRVIAGILSPDRGRIERANASCQLLSLSLGFLPHLSGRDNAILSGLLFGLSYRAIARCLPAILEFSELGDFFDEPISTYSTGMVSRLGFSVAMQVEPDILLIDEILSVGDAEFREKSGRALHDRMHNGTTVVLVAHDDEAIRRICTHALWIEHGRSIMYGKVSDVLHAYHQDTQPTAAVTVRT